MWFTRFQLSLIEQIEELIEPKDLLNNWNKHKVIEISIFK